MRVIDLDGLLPGEVGWVCACDDPEGHPLIKGAWHAAHDECPKRMPAFRMRAEQVNERVRLAVEPAA